MGFDILPVSFRERTPNVTGTFFVGVPAVAGVRAALTPTDQYLATVAQAIDGHWTDVSHLRFTQTLGPEYFEPRTIRQGYFVQDDIRLSDRVKVNLRLRYELFTMPLGVVNKRRAHRSRRARVRHRTGHRRRARRQSPT